MFPADGGQAYVKRQLTLGQLLEEKLLAVAAGGGAVVGTAGAVPGARAGNVGAVPVVGGAISKSAGLVAKAAGAPPSVAVAKAPAPAKAGPPDRKKEAPLISEAALVDHFLQLLEERLVTVREELVGKEDEENAAALLPMERFFGMLNLCEEELCRTHDVENVAEFRVAASIPRWVEEHSPRVLEILNALNIAVCGPTKELVRRGIMGTTAVPWAGSGRYRKDPQNPHRIFVVLVSLLAQLVVVCWYVNSRTWDTRRGRGLVCQIEV